MKRRRWNAGFTLVELAVVVTVASVALTATAGAVTSGAKLARTTAELRASSRSAQSVMERIRATPFADIVTTFHGQTYAMNTLGGGDSTGTASIYVTPVDTGSTRWRVMRVAVITQWTGTAGPSTQTMITYVGDRTDGSSLSGSRTTVPTN